MSSSHEYIEAAREERTGDSFGKFISSSIPGFVQDQIARRLRYVAMTVFCLASVIILSYFVGAFQSIWGTPHALRDTAFLIGLAAGPVSAGLVLFLLRRERPKTELIIIAVIFENWIAFFAATHDAFWPYPDNFSPPPMIFWTCIWVVFYPLMIPISPRISLLSSVSSVLAVLAGLALPMLIAPELTPPWVIFRMAIETHVVMCITAYTGSRTINYLNWQIALERKKGSYALVRLLGEGSMGQVWLARHRMLHRPAAMKIIQSEVLLQSSEDSRQQFISRFEREAQATSSLYNQHSVSLYDFGVMDDGSFFYVMEALDGVDLSDLVRAWGPTPPARTVYILKQICESLSEAHDIGLIHRDLKPAHIFLCRFGNHEDIVKVLDFGMAKFSRDLDARVSRDAIPGLDSPELTQAGALSGTPAYMAPEMIAGAMVDHRYDIYAFGCVAYWLLTGKRLFETESLMDQLNAHSMKDPIPPGERVGKSFPPVLEALILKCLEKAPEDRPQTIDEIGRSLEMIDLDDQWKAVDAQQWWAKHLPKPGSEPMDPDEETLMSTTKVLGIPGD